jgi:Gas vesicle synthesis protein GvpL/GvpF
VRPAHGGKVLHVYGLVEAASPSLRGLRGRQGNPVRRIRHGPVAVLVSELDESARLKRQDLLAHAHVLERIADRQAVLPMRFGVKAQSEQDLRLRVRDTAAWAALLRRFTGLVQVSIEAAHLEEEALRELIRRDPVLLELRERIASEDEWRGHAYKVQLGERVAHALEALRREDASTLLHHFVPLAREFAERAAPGQVLSASFLVEREQRNAFDAAVTRAQETLPWVQLRYLGPQPPWAFVDVTPPGNEAAWDS